LLSPQQDADRRATDRNDEDPDELRNENPSLASVFEPRKTHEGVFQGIDKNVLRKPDVERKPKSQKIYTVHKSALECGVDQCKKKFILVRKFRRHRRLIHKTQTSRIDIDSARISTHRTVRLEVFLDKLLRAHFYHLFLVRLFLASQLFAQILETGNAGNLASAGLGVPEVNNVPSFLPFLTSWTKSYSDYKSYKPQNSEKLDARARRYKHERLKAKADRSSIWAPVHESYLEDCIEGLQRLGSAVPATTFPRCMSALAAYGLVFENLRRQYSHHPCLEKLCRQSDTARQASQANLKANISDLIQVARQTASDLRQLVKPVQDRLDVLKKQIYPLKGKLVRIGVELTKCGISSNVSLREYFSAVKIMSPYVGLAIEHFLFGDKGTDPDDCTYIQGANLFCALFSFFPPSSDITGSTLLALHRQYDQISQSAVQALFWKDASLESHVKFSDRKMTQDHRHFPLQPSLDEIKESIQQFAEKAKSDWGFYRGVDGSANACGVNPKPVLETYAKFAGLKGSDIKMIKIAGDGFVGKFGKWTFWVASPLHPAFLPNSPGNSPVVLLIPEHESPELHATSTERLFGELNDWREQRRSENDPIHVIFGADWKLLRDLLGVWCPFCDATREDHVSGHHTQYDPESLVHLPGGLIIQLWCIVFDCLHAKMRITEKMVALVARIGEQFCADAIEGINAYLKDQLKVKSFRLSVDDVRLPEGSIARQAQMTGPEADLVLNNVDDVRPDCQRPFSALFPSCHSVCTASFRSRHRSSHRQLDMPMESVQVLVCKTECCICHLIQPEASQES
jgi:hypothetical protein